MPFAESRRISERCSSAAFSNEMTLGLSLPRWRCWFLGGTAASTPDSCYAGLTRATKLASWKQNSATRTYQGLSPALFAFSMSPG
jgi:hypothetical protein